MAQRAGGAMHAGVPPQTKLEHYPTVRGPLACTRIACDLGRAAYDCFYLAVAETLRQPLVTADLRLVHAVRASRLAKHVLPSSELGAG
jgi:predicted nucleic acid-binding protein